jgi:hypothetical protein
VTRIADDQFQQILDRAQDPRRRTYMAGIAADAQPMDFEQLKSDFKEHGAPAAQGLLGLADMLAPMMDKLGEGAFAMGPDGPMRIGGKASSPDLAPAPPAALVKAVEQQMGIRLPEALKQLYSIADGGFGPGKGLFKLLELGRRYREQISMGGPSGQEWPENLVPLFDEDPVLVCLDIESGKVIAWDPEEIDDPENFEQWEDSFKAEHDSLAAYMAAWVESPIFEEHMPMPPVTPAA